MAHNWILIDAQQSTHLAPWSLKGETIGWPELNITLESRRGGLSEGVQLLTVSIGEHAWRIIPTRGMSLWNASAGDWQVGWQSPTPGPVHPQHVPLSEPSGLGWLDGFDELLVRCGLESNGAPEFDANQQLRFGLHGRIANLPAQTLQLQVDPKAKTVKVTGQVDEVRFHFAKLRLTASYQWQQDGAACEITDTIDNLSASPGIAQLLYHINLGTPLLEENARFLAPVKRIVPRNPHAAQGLDHWNLYPAPTPGFTEQVYFLGLHHDDQQQSLVLLENAARSQAVSLRFDTSRLPCFSLWKNPTALEDGYVTGIEPATNFPNPRSFEEEHGRIIQLPPKGSFQSNLRIELLTNPENITAQEKEIEQLQQQSEPQIETSPTADWCAD